MTSDAKIGLLLGLVFIVIIAFVINGLPILLKASPYEQVITTSITNVDESPLDLTGRAEKAVKSINETDFHRQLRQIDPTSKDYEDVRFAIELDRQPVQQLPVRNIPLPGASAKAKVRFYTVMPGDNLAVIAKKFYGDEMGNKNAVVNKLYEANTSILDSADDIVVGDKLRIPPLHSLVEKQPIGSSGVSMLAKLKTVTSEKVSAWKETFNKPRNSEYVVMAGDSLWRIAQQKLGNGNRYHEIIRLNNSVIDDVEELKVGMRLKLPAR